MSVLALPHSAVVYVITSVLVLPTFCSSIHYFTVGSPHILQYYTNTLPFPIHLYTEISCDIYIAIIKRHILINI
jgi:hypothetical protein